MPFGYHKQPVKAVISDVTATRAIDGTIYQNTSGRPILCIVAISALRAAVAGAAALATACVEDTTPPTVTVALVGLYIIDSIGEYAQFMCSFMVPNGYYYNVTKTETGVGSVVNFGSWIEVQL